MAPRRVSIGSTDSAFDDGLFDRAGDGGRSGTSGRSRSSRGSTSVSSFDGPGFRRFLLVVVVLVLAALPLATAAIAVFVDSDEVVAWLTPRLSGALNRDVRIGDAGIALLPRPGLRLSDVRVGGGPDSELPSVLAARDVHMEAAWLPLFTGRVTVDRIRVDGLDVRLEVSETGTSNFGDLVPESQIVQTARRGPVGFAVAGVTVDDMSLTYFDGLRDRSFAVSGGSGDLDLRIEPDGGWSAAAVGAADSLLIRAPGISDEIVRSEAPSIDLTVRGDGSMGWLEIPEGSIRHRGQALAVEGRVEGLSEADPEVDLRFSNPELDLSVVTAFLPESVRARRQPALVVCADVRLNLRGDLRGAERPVLRGSFGLSDAGLHLGGESWISDVSGDLRLRDETVELDSLRGSFADGPFDLSATLHKKSRRVVGTLKAAPDIDDFRRLGLRPFGFTVAGGAEMALDFAGPVASPDSMRVDGSLLLTGVQAERPDIGVPLYLPSANLHLQGTTIAWTDLTLLVGTEPLLTSGSVDGVLGAGLSAQVTPVLEASVSGEHLDLGAAFPPGDDAPGVTYPRIAFAQLGGRPLDGVEVGDVIERAGLHRPRELPVHGSLDVSVDGLRYRSYDLADVTARVVLSDSILTVDDLRASAWGGQLVAALDLGIGARVDEPFALRFEVQDVDGAAFLGQMTPVGEAITGRLQMATELNGTVDRSLMPLLAPLDGTVEATLVDGVVEGTGINLALADFLAEERWRILAFHSWRTEMALQDGMLQVVDSELQSDAATASLTGAVGLGGAADLAMSLSIPPDRLEAISLRRTGVAQTVLDRLRETENPLDLGIRISGTLQGPTLEPDALAASEGGGR